MINGGRVDYWGCVNFSSRLDPGLPSEFCHQLVSMCNSKGMVRTINFVSYSRIRKSWFILNNLCKYVLEFVVRFSTLLRCFLYTLHMQIKLMVSLETFIVGL